MNMIFDGRKIVKESLLLSDLRQTGNGNRITFARGASYVAQLSKMNHCSELIEKLLGKKLPQFL